MFILINLIIYSKEKYMRLTEYLEERGMPLAAFARRVDISWPTANNILHGQDVRLSIAIRVEKFTNGKVTCQDLYNALQEKLNRKEP
jgi:predicted transcriptional regulator